MRKNRQKRTRQRGLTRQFADEDGDRIDQLVGSERISGKGDLSRHRTVLGVTESEDGSLVIQVDEQSCVEGRVLSAMGLNCVVQVDDGTTYECTVRKRVRDFARDARNAVVTGDVVQIQIIDELRGVVERVEPRARVLARGSDARQHIIVANVDQLLIVVSAADPPLKPGFIDRMLISAEKGGVRALICINKIDLVDPTELQTTIGMYSRLGYQVVATSAERRHGVDTLKSLLSGRETVLSGQSGVGKSSLINTLQTSTQLAVGQVSSWSHKGRHVTRRAILLPLDRGGWVVDTPGIRQLQLWDVGPGEVEGYFIEFRPFVPLCRFPNCLHLTEVDCGVKRAVAEGLVAEDRYDSYQRVLSGD